MKNKEDIYKILTTYDTDTEEFKNLETKAKSSEQIQIWVDQVLEEIQSHHRNLSIIQNEDYRWLHHINKNNQRKLNKKAVVLGFIIIIFMIVFSFFLFQRENTENQYMLYRSLATKAKKHGKELLTFDLEYYLKTFEIDTLNVHSVLFSTDLAADVSKEPDNNSEKHNIYKLANKAVEQNVKRGMTYTYVLPIKSKEIGENFKKEEDNYKTGNIKIIYISDEMYSKWCGKGEMQIFFRKYNDKIVPFVSCDQEGDDSRRICVIVDQYELIIFLFYEFYEILPPELMEEALSELRRDPSVITKTLQGFMQKKELVEEINVPSPIINYDKLNQ